MIIQIAQFLLGLSILIILHEFGHFIPAKLFGTRVEKFYLFFDYKFSLIKKKIGDTVYGIGWIPLGGYVKISGMVDESMDTEGLSKDPEPWEFRAKPAWQRLIILSGGVIVNFAIAIVIYAGMMAYYGESYIETKNVSHGYVFADGLKEMGLQDGDKIISIGGKKLTRVTDVFNSIIVGLDEEIVVERNGEEKTFVISAATIGEILDKKQAPIDLAIPFILDSVARPYPIDSLALRPNDRIMRINDQSIPFYNDYLEAAADYAGDTVSIGVLRNGEMALAMAYIDTAEKVGVILHNPIIASDTTYTGMAAIGAGWKKTVSQLDYYIRQFKVIFNSETGAVKQLGGFKTMMNQYAEGSWNWERFWGVTAFISIMLGFLNILPIPALDGGHVVFTIIEMVTGRKPSIKVLEYAQMIGFFLLLGLILFANLNDFGVWDLFK